MVSVLVRKVSNALGHSPKHLNILLRLSQAPSATRIRPSVFVG